jgi:hypothetical protein
MLAFLVHRRTGRRHPAAGSPTARGQDPAQIKYHVDRALHHRQAGTRLHAGAGPTVMRATLSNAATPGHSPDDQDALADHVDDEPITALTGLLTRPAQNHFR